MLSFFPDGAYNDALERIKTRPMIVPRVQNTKEKEEATRDYYAGVRTNVLLAWVLSNVRVSLAVSQQTDH